MSRFRQTRADSAYSSNKAAVYRFGETLAKQLAPYGVSVFTISPGLVRTAMTEGHYGDDAPWAEPELAAKLIRTLASGRADALSGRVFCWNRDSDFKYVRASHFSGGRPARQQPWLCAPQARRR